MQVLQRFGTQQRLKDTVTSWCSKLANANEQDWKVHALMQTELLQHQAEIHQAQSFPSQQQLPSPKEEGDIEDRVMTMMEMMTRGVLQVLALIV